MNDIALTELADESTQAIQYLQSIAHRKIIDQDRAGVLSKPAMQAELAHEMLAESVNVRTAFQAATVRIALYVYREHLWVHHPMYDFADDYKGFWDFLVTTGLTKPVASMLAGLSYIVVPFCDHHNIEIDRYADPDVWTKTREVLVALKRAVGDKDPAEVRQILATVDATEGAPVSAGRDALRRMYRQSNPLTGRGTTVKLADGSKVLVVAFKTDKDIGKAVARVGSLTEWDLVAVSNGQKIEVEPWTSE